MTQNPNLNPRIMDIQAAHELILQALSWLERSGLDPDEHAELFCVLEDSVETIKDILAENLAETNL